MFRVTVRNPDGTILCWDFDNEYDAGKALVSVAKQRSGADVVFTLVSLPIQSGQE